MDIQDMLAVPRLFCTKIEGRLRPELGMGDEVFSVKTGYLFRFHGVVGCGNPDCDCIDKAFAKFCKGVEVVPVEVCEVGE